MKYISEEEYISMASTEVNTTDIGKLIELASISVNNASLTRIEKKGFENLTPKQQEYIKKAVVEQTEYIKEMQENGDTSKVSSYSLDDININLKDSKEIYEELELSHEAYMYLKETGLMFRGC